MLTGQYKERSYLKRFLLLCVASLLTACGAERIQPAAVPASGVYAELAQQVFAETNALRRDPQAYASVLKDIRRRTRDDIYYPYNTEVGVRIKEGSGVIDEAIRVVAAEQKRSTLRWSDALARAAMVHVQDIGPKGLVSHESSRGETLTQRLDTVMEQERFTIIAENIAFGYDGGRDVVAQLYIDDGVASRGHRKNLMKSKINYTGVACGVHKLYRHMCVAIYAYRDE